MSPDDLAAAYRAVRAIKPPPRAYVAPVYPVRRGPVRERPLPPVNARSVRCPVCGARPRVGCETPSLRLPLADHHLDRIAAARAVRP